MFDNILVCAIGVVNVARTATEITGFETEDGASKDMCETDSYRRGIPIFLPFLIAVVLVWFKFRKGPQVSCHCSTQLTHRHFLNSLPEREEPQRGFSSDPICALHSSLSISVSRIRHAGRGETGEKGASKIVSCRCSGRPERIVCLRLWATFSHIRRSGPFERIFVWTFHAFHS